MTLTRREALCSLAAAPALQSAGEGWTAEWDRALIAAAVRRLDTAFDPAENMLRSRVGAAYRYHTNLRSVDVHGTRDSLAYALFLLEAGQPEKASRVIDRVIALQDVDPSSKWYGIWSYYLEEPLPKMSPADWNWADFNGSTLLLIELRHGAKLAPELRKRVVQAIGHAAASVRRRNVSMSYTNIAVQGTFVTLAAAELAGDQDLLAYSRDRLRRFARTVDETGSFAEYNSPTYADVTIENFTRMLMYVRDQESLPLVRKLNDRVWLHIASHWHAPTRQLAGPMSRAYSTDIGKPLWLQKALNNRIMWSTLSELAESSDGETALLKYSVPARVQQMFLTLQNAREHRELFLPGVQGTTWLHPRYTLGSVNRGDFWVQRRPVLAYWGRPAKYAQLRFLKDDYDFSSALIYSVQREGYVLGVVNFRAPGGDKHISLDPLPPEFPARRLRLYLELPNEPKLAEKTGSSASYELEPRLRLDFAVRDGRFGDARPILAVEPRGLSVDLLPAGVEKVRWADAGEAFLVFTLSVSAKPAGAFDRETWSWTTPAGRLRIEASKRVAPVGDQDRAFAAFIDERPITFARLSDERLVL